MPEPVATDDLPQLSYEPPAGTELVGFWCGRGGGHVTPYACTSDSVPLFAQRGWAGKVRTEWLERFDD